MDDYDSETSVESVEQPPVRRGEWVIQRPPGWRTRGNNHPRPTRRTNAQAALDAARERQQALRNRKSCLRNCVGDLCEKVTCGVTRFGLGGKRKTKKRKRRRKRKKRKTRKTKRRKKRKKRKTKRRRR